jgi:4-methoxybenzoate monooxygenase (O-demethylating)
MSAVDFAGRTLTPDTMVQLFNGAANRDPRKLENADRFDVTRKSFGHIAMGAGIHIASDR